MFCFRQFTAINTVNVSNVHWQSVTASDTFLTFQAQVKSYHPSL